MTIGSWAVMVGSFVLLRREAGGKPLRARTAAESRHWTPLDQLEDRTGCGAHIGAARALVQILGPLLGPRPNRRADMSELGLDFELGEMADAIRDTTRRFAADQIAPLAARIDAEDWFPTELWPRNGRARPARDHRRRGGWRARARLSRACRRAGGSGARLGLDRPLLRRPFEPLRQPDQALGDRRAEGEISAQIDLAASMSARSPCRRRARAPTWSR